MIKWEQNRYRGEKIMSGLHTSRGMVTRKERTKKQKKNTHTNKQKKIEKKTKTKLKSKS